MNIAIIGTGRVSTALSKKFIEAGHQVAIGSRNPEEHPGSVSQQEAVASAELVITAVPGMIVIPTLEAVGEEALGQRILLDLSVPVKQDMVLAYPNDSLAHNIQERFPKLKVVKALNTMNTSIMIEPFKTLSHATVFVCGDDAEAKTTVKSLLNDLGWTEESILDLGGVEMAKGTEHVALLYFETSKILQTPVFNIAVIRPKS